MGGGTGAHASVWAGEGVRAVVLDPARGMVLRAARLPGVRAVAGRAEDLPFPDGTFRLAYFHLSLHYGDWREALREATRVAGTVWVWTFAHSYLRSSYLSRWFPSVADRDLERFPPLEGVVRRLEELGLRARSGGPVEEERTWRAGDWAEAVRAGFIGTLHLLDPDEVEAGLDAFRRAHPDPRESIVYRLPFVWVVAGDRLRPGYPRT